MFRLYFTSYRKSKNQKIHISYVNSYYISETLDWRLISKSHPSIYNKRWFLTRKKIHSTICSLEFWRPHPEMSYWRVYCSLLPDSDPVFISVESIQSFLLVVSELDLREFITSTHLVQLKTTLDKFNHWIKFKEKLRGIYSKRNFWISMHIEITFLYQVELQLNYFILNSLLK